MVLRNNRLYVGDNTSQLFVLYLDGTSYAAPTGDGAVKGFLWPDRRNDNLYFSTTNKVHAVRDTGSGFVDLWSPIAVLTPSMVLQKPGTDFIYVGNGNGGLVQINVSTQAQITLPLEGAGVQIGAPSLDGGNNLLMVGSSTGTIHAVRVPLLVRRKSMKVLLLALVLAAPSSSASDDKEGRAGDRERVSCSVNVHALDSQGESRSARRVSAGVAPAVIFSGKVSPQDENALPLVFDVFNPRGQRYQILLATERVVVQERGGHRIERVSRIRQASMAVAGSSIAWTSMYGRWRVEPRIEGTSKPCGQPEYFTIRP